MKILIAFVIITSALLAGACSYQKKLGIDMPQGLSEARKKQVLQQFADGKKAYLSHCAACHNKTVNGKEVIPDISFEQADTYRVRFTNDKHKDELKTEAVTEKELDNIVIFFKYKKESGVAPF